MQKALAQVEDAEDVIAARRAAEEERAELREFEDDEGEDGDAASLLPKAEWEDELTVVQKYALHFLQDVAPVIDYEELRRQHEAIEREEKQWETQQKSMVRALCSAPRPRLTRV